jgi:hypothetical protein
MKMILARTSSLLRGTPADVAILVSALFTALNPTFMPEGVEPRRVADLSRRIHLALPHNSDSTLGVIALETAGMLGARVALVGPAAEAWANRAALLAVGDPHAALEGIAWRHGHDHVPLGAEERTGWLARHADARDLMTFSVTDAYMEARSRLGVR